MPYSYGQTANENEIECPRCGEIFPMDLSRCPNCGLNMYEPEEEIEEPGLPPHERKKPGFKEKLTDLWKGLTKQNYKAEDVFGAVLDTAFIYNDLLNRVGGDHKTAERLIELEQKDHPKAVRKELIQLALDRLDRDQQ